ncbi:RagB/SusD family nutrient uptake outer membrane protein [Mucilaginibacter boryungensis]|uniref:RagB/SusD family nutrient uptake outer membrane protein n=1 Tax=Mucilaginibacter boryungensis TaxID=768480 RepID=A0ABR9XG88_9SPHI|nr:RagB/SusD family nutrient uptake outer membrane protein [Mucilaginibacter boryungensis]MBE9666392.1 RagB/SusD family nutrient uptake outer membrane protein [Mucilaginibacter boryungensis]
MKKIFFLSTISAVALMTACKKDLNQVPISTSTTATFYLQPSDFLQASNAIYADLHNYPNRLQNLSEIRSDNIYGVSVTVRDWDPINDFSPSLPANAYVTEAWTTDFNGIFRANTLLDQLAKNGSLVGSATLATRLQAEAKFLRAFFYFDLVRYFGKLPIIDHPVSAAEANTISRSPVADVYKLITSDLQFAIANLPGSYTGVDVGRATKYSAEALLAEAYMAKSGPTYGIEGPGLASNEWNLALPLLQDIITNGGFVFNPNYANIFAYTNQGPAVNKESVFDVIYTSGISGTSDLYGASYPWNLTPNGYFLSLKDTKSNGSLEIIPVSPDLASSYAATDVRKAATIYTAGYTNAGSTENRPFFKKWLDVSKLSSVLSRFDWGIDYIAIRYTDVLMMKAECILHGAPGSQSDVDAIVNQVRTRAGLPSITGVTLPQLFDERRREFADEGLRWFDLQRSGNLLTIMNAWIAKDDAQKAIKPAIANYIIYPVPQREIDTTPGLYTQNPGY